jgi:hypothetical protein
MKTIILTDVEALVCSRLLEEAVDAMSNNGCNDCPIEVTEDNMMDMIALANKTSCDKEDLGRLLEKIHPGNTVYFTDFVVLSILRDKIRSV